MISIPKGFNKDLSKSQNYRGIALSSLFSKIIDHCIISCEDAALKSDDLQIAYKSGMYTIQCASVVTETINYYLHNKSDIYRCLFPVPILAASDLIQALTLIITTLGFYSDFFITFDRSNWRRIIRDAMDGTHPKVL